MGGKESLPQRQLLVTPQPYQSSSCIHHDYRHAVITSGVHDVMTIDGIVTMIMTYLPLPSSRIILFGGTLHPSLHTSSMIPPEQLEIVKRNSRYALLLDPSWIARGSGGGNSDSSGGGSSSTSSKNDEKGSSSSSCLWQYVDIPALPFGEKDRKYGNNDIVMHDHTIYSNSYGSAPHIRVATIDHHHHDAGSSSGSDNGNGSTGVTLDAMTPSGLLYSPHFMVHHDRVHCHSQGNQVHLISKCVGGYHAKNSDTAMLAVEWQSASSSPQSFRHWIGATTIPADGADDRYIYALTMEQFLPGVVHTRAESLYIERYDHVLNEWRILPVHIPSSQWYSSYVIYVAATRVIMFIDDSNRRTVLGSQTRIGVIQMDHIPSHTFVPPMSEEEIIAARMKALQTPSPSPSLPFTREVTPLPLQMPYQDMNRFTYFVIGTWIYLIGGTYDDNRRYNDRCYACDTSVKDVKKWKWIEQPHLRLPVPLVDLVATLTH